MRVAAVDIGTNTVRLLVADSAGGGLVELVRHVSVTRLGQEVDSSGVIHPEASERTLGVLREYGMIMDELGAGRRRAVATSAVRDAGNASDFLDAVAALGSPSSELPVASTTRPAMARRSW